ncbi:hypothetical protein [Novosphingobium lentum]|uniref:hypothetical protein n=1 Tax=Novosphingobium lentum TaxID=145287 RepID=UPI00082C9C35|nr:hypothetical protein [Novosphingobium lentum]
MNGGPRIIPIEPGQPDNAAVEDLRAFAADAPLLLRPEDESWDDESPTPQRDMLAWLAPVGVAIIIAAWTGFFIWANLGAMQAGATPAVWAQWIGQWSVPVLLCLTALLVAMRNSRREAGRFADAGQSLRAESEALERRLVSVNTELSLARDFLAAQGRDLEALGRIAVDRLSGSADRLQALIVDNGAQVSSIGDVSVNALDNMEKLRGHLPVIANSVRDVTNTIASAGRTAHVQLEDLVTGFHRLNEFGVASERQVESLRGVVNEALAEFTLQADQLDTITTARFAALASEGEAHRQNLDQIEIAALAGIRTRSASLERELAAHRESTEAGENSAYEALRARLVALREESNSIARAIAGGESEALNAWTERAASHRETLRHALEGFATDHEMAIAAASTRLGAFEQAARGIGSTLDDHLRRIDEEFATRRQTAEDAAGEQDRLLTERLDAVDRAITQRHQAMTATGVSASDTMTQRLGELDRLIAQQRTHQTEQADALATRFEALSERVNAFSAVLRASGEQGAATAAAVDRAMAMLNSRLVESGEALAGTDGQVADLTDSAVRLLELIQASSDHTRIKLPEAVKEAEGGLRGIEDRVFMLRDTLKDAGERGHALSEHVLASRNDMAGALADVGSLHGEFTARTQDQQNQLAALRETLAAARSQSEQLAGDIQASLAGAIAQLSGAVENVGASLRHGTASEIEAIASQLGDHSSAAIAKVLQGRGAELVLRLEEAIDRAAEAGRDTTVQLRDQLAKVDELAGNLENRVDRARERAEDRVDNDFARRAALITESLKSTAIDIARALSSDVSETAWASYLRGDRGIFTRRAVSLLESGEARIVAQHYDSDEDFRLNVNRYIHDFEAMLRQLLSTRDGNALGVTLLSSDMGKLYVVLAQGIERLRA